LFINRKISFEIIIDRQSVIQPETSSTDVQRGSFNNEPTLTGQSVQDQQPTQTLNLESSTDLNNDQLKSKD
jgi:hypothetical protein